MLTAVAGTCFTLEYTYPGRWLTRRNLVLLGIPPLLAILLTLVNDAHLIWRELPVGPDGTVAARYAPLGVLLLACGWGLIVINAAALVWLFVRSPPHRWPAAIIMFGQLAARAVFLLEIARVPTPVLLDPAALSVVLAFSGYAIALFGFRILDPLPAARQTVIEQMHAGVAVFDARWQVVSLNPAAQRILGLREGAARGKTWQQVMPAGRLPPSLTDASRQPAGSETELPEMILENDAVPRHYAPALAELRDFRGLLMGRVLTLRDVTEQRRAQAQILEQQRASAMLQERERLARELHDELGQVLAYVTVQARAARDQVDRDHKETAHEYLTQLITAAQDAHCDVREYISGAKLTSDPDFDLLLALEQYLRRFAANNGISAELTVPPGLRSDAFDPVVRVQLLRIIQEALTNARKHASAEHVTVRFEPAGSRAKVMIRDDGIGFEPEPDNGDGGHFGLGFMRERAREMGGAFTIVSGPGRGTQVIVEAPLRG
jgi:PAS domain S-box-containing protein